MIFNPLNKNHGSPSRLKTEINLIFTTFAFTHQKGKAVMMMIKVLGTGCPNCKTLEKNTRQAVAEEGIDVTVLKEEDMTKILGYNVMRMPALVIDEQVAMFGRVPSVEEIRELLRQYVS
jgi:small redox-active disulfide protein 2